MEKFKSPGTHLGKKTIENDLLSARKKSIIDFNGIEHRMEKVTEINGTEYINDSKATDFTATFYSLSSMSKPVIWIVGSSEVQNDFLAFSELVKEKVKAIVCLGKNNSHSFNLLKKEVKFFAEVNTISEAVESASSFACGDDVVLFSPACPSFEMFESYKQRGECFRKAVLSW